MVEEDNKQKKEDEFERIDLRRKLMIHRLNNNFLMNTFYNMFYWSVLAFYILTHPKEGMSEILRKEGRTGFLEKSIIGNPLYIPKEDGQFELIDALSGQWVGYDLKRKDEFLNENLTNTLLKGKLSCFLIEEIKRNKKNDYTPTARLQLLNLSHLLHLEVPGIDYMVENELIEPKSYEDSFKSAKIYEKYAHNLHVLGIAEREVYQVTPKGNGLVFLINDGGDKIPKKLPFMKPAFE